MLVNSDDIRMDGKASEGDNSSNKFPPISRQSANFNQQDMMRSLDPFDKMEKEINELSPMNVAESNNQNKAAAA